MTRTNRIRVAVIYGGMSSEHAVSCVTAAAIMDHLDPERYEIVPVGITRDGVWTTGTTNRDKLSMGPDGDCEVELVDEVSLSVNPHRRGEFVYASGDKAGTVYGTADVIFPALHGKCGEDGTIQGLFELSRVPYVGCGVLASAACMDKQYTKLLLSSAGLPVAAQRVLRKGQSLSQDDKQALGLPVYVKPASGGSSIGVSKVTKWADLDAAVALALAEDAKVLVESQVSGCEVELGVLERPDGTIIASSPARLIGTQDSEEGFYGFATKYLAGTVHAEIPAAFDEQLVDTLRAMALKAFAAVNGQGLSRVDFFVTDQGPVINEINTMPGFTPISMYPQVFAADGISYTELVDTLIATAFSHAEA